MTATASLTLTGSVAALAAALQAFDEYGEDAPQIVGNAASINTGTGIPAPTLTPSEPSGDVLTPTVPMPTTFNVSTTTPTAPTGEDEDGEPSDGTGLDVEGLPWDARIHSSSKKKTAKGVWVSVRNSPKGAELAAIKDELRGMIQQPLPMPAVSEPVQPVAVPMPAVDTSTSLMMPAPVPMPVPMPAVSEPVQPSMPVTMQPAPIPMPVASEPVAPVEAPAALVPLATAAVLEWDFAKLMGVLGPKIGAGAITTDYLVQVCQKYGLNAVTDTAQKPEVIPQLIGQFQADGVW